MLVLDDANRLLYLKGGSRWAKLLVYLTCAGVRFVAIGAVAARLRGETEHPSHVRLVLAPGEEERVARVLDAVAARRIGPEDGIARYETDLGDLALITEGYYERLIGATLFEISGAPILVAL